MQIGIDDVIRTMTIRTSWQDLLSPTTVAHVHCCTASSGVGVAPPATTLPTLPGFPEGVTAGSYNNTLDLKDPLSWNSAFVAANGGTVDAAFTALLAGLVQGRAYFNIHSTLYPDGEIRGDLAAVPLPAAAWLFLAGLGAMAARRKRERVTAAGD